MWHAIRPSLLYELYYQNMIVKQSRNQKSILEIFLSSLCPFPSFLPLLSCPSPLSSPTESGLSNADKGFGSADSFAQLGKRHL